MPSTLCVLPAAAVTEPVCPPQHRLPALVRAAFASSPVSRAFVPFPTQTRAGASKYKSYLILHCSFLFNLPDLYFQFNATQPSSVLEIRPTCIWAYGLTTGRFEVDHMKAPPMLVRLLPALPALDPDEWLAVRLPVLAPRFLLALQQLEHADDVPCTTQSASLEDRSVLHKDRSVLHDDRLVLSED